MDLNNIGIAYWFMGMESNKDRDFDRALFYYGDALKLAKKTGHKKTKTGRNQYQNKLIYYKLRNCRSIKKKRVNHPSEEKVKSPVVVQSNGMLINFLHFF